MARKAQQSPKQKRIVERVMHEFKEGDLRIRGGRKVKNPKQAIAIALSEAGASNRESPEANRRNRRRTEKRERADRTASPRERLGSQASKTGRARTRAELYAEAKRRDIPGRSKMSRAELETALR
jgi:Family of unknown function (DUF6496)